MENKKRQFDADEPRVPWSQEDQNVEDLLSQALSTNELPEGFSDRVMAASAPMLPLSPEAVELDAMLADATRVESPDGLTDRVMAASLKELHGESPVIGRVGFVETIQRLALAACIVLAVFVAVRMDIGSPRRVVKQVALQDSKVLSVEEEGYLLDDLSFGEYAYLADTRELDFAELAVELNGIRNDLELWQYGLLTE
jgi:hypothetical protein